MLMTWGDPLPPQFDYLTIRQHHVFHPAAYPVSCLNHENAFTEASELGGCRQSGETGTNDNAVQHRSSCQRTRRRAHRCATGSDFTQRSEWPTRPPRRSPAMVKP
jgi:hypothetical protein